MFPSVLCFFIFKFCIKGIETLILLMMLDQIDGEFLIQHQMVTRVDSTGGKMVFMPLRYKNIPASADTQGALPSSLCWCR